MASEKVVEYYEKNKEDIDLIKKHGDQTVRAMARAIERVAKGKT
ncbi:MAG: hypothetical protein ACOC5T_09605 [Elusimicrobiota bacterium]